MNAALSLLMRFSMAAVLKCRQSRFKTNLLRWATGGFYMRAPMAGPVGSPTTTSFSVVRAALSVAMFFAALITVCATIRSIVPFPAIPGVYEKYLYLQKHKDEYDILFVGSSRFYQQVIPVQFDARVQELCGQKLRSFNFGFNGMWPPESYYMLRKVLAWKCGRLRWVFIDGMDIGTQLGDPRLPTLRLTHWHDGPHTWMALRKVVDSDRSLMAKWELAVGHGAILFRQWTNQGQGAEWIGYEFGINRRQEASRWDLPKESKDAEGYVPHDAPFAGAPRAEYEDQVKAAIANFAPKPLTPAFKDAVTAIAAEVRAAGAQPILVLTPTVNPRESFSGFPPDLPVWSYQGPQQFPELYDARNRVDPRHLNSSGAKVFTELLATRFAEHLQERK